MSEPVANPERLSSLPETEDSLGVGRLFRNARALPDEEFPTLRWRLGTSQRLRAIRPRLLLKVALVIGIAFCMGGVVGAAVWPLWAGKKSKPVGAVSPPGSPIAAATVRHGMPRAAIAAPAVPEPFEPVADVTEPAADPVLDQASLVTDGQKPLPVPAKRRSVRVVVLNEPAASPSISVSPAAASPIAVEQALLGQSMKTLREGHDARTALALLAQHADRFPGGALGSEATMLRIEALLTLGSRDEALSVLDQAPLASLPNRDEQFVVRGELRAARGRWREAEHDFDEALRDRGLLPASARARGIQERSLWGRAAARSRLGDQTGARADLDRYLRLFPAGQFAGHAAALLKVAP